MTKKTVNKPSKFVTMAALDPYIQDNIVRPTEKEVHGQRWIEYGEKNLYPNYLYDLYQNSTSLHTLIDSCTDYVLGDRVVSNCPYLTDMTASKLVKQLGFNILLTGGVFVNVLRNKLGEVCKVVPLDFRKVRSDKDGEFFYYSDDFAVKSYGRGKYMSYPAFDPEKKTVATSIYYYTNSPYTTYAQPVYCTATKSCEIEKKIAEYHLNNLNNNFSANYIVTFLNGIPTDEVREEIEEMFNQKYTGSENSGRPVISFAPDKDHAVQIDKLDSENWGDKFNTLKKDCRQDIFTCFRCTPNILGIPTETTGFNSEEYAGAFKIFTRSFIQPIQKTICSIVDGIFGKEDCIKIEPYTIDFEEDGQDIEEISSTEVKEEENNGK